MAIKRRGFLKRLGGLILTGLLLRSHDHTSPAHYVEAVRANNYPGPKKICDPSEIAKPGKWAG